MVMCFVVVLVCYMLLLCCGFCCGVKIFGEGFVIEMVDNVVIW